MASFFKSPLIWVAAAVTTVGLVLWSTKSGGDAGGTEPQEPDDLKPGQIPTQADCNWAYSQLPMEMQSAYEGLVAVADATGSTAALNAFADDIEDEESIDPKVRSIFAACIRKGVKLAGGDASPIFDPTPDNSDSYYGGDDGGSSPVFDPSQDDGYFSPDPTPTFNPYLGGGNYTDAAPVGSSAQLQNLLGGISPLNFKPTGWPAINALPSGAPKSAALNSVAGVDYRSIFNFGTGYENGYQPCLNNGSPCSSVIIRAAISLLVEANYGLGSDPMRIAAITELDKAAVRLESEGL